MPTNNTNIHQHSHREVVPTPKKDNQKGKNSFDQIINTAVEVSRLLGGHHKKHTHGYLH